MSARFEPAQPGTPDGANQNQAARKATWVDYLTAGLLCAVIATLGWMCFVSYAPEVLRLPSVATEIALVLILLTAALGSVSVVAVLHTRR